MVGKVMKKRLIVLGIAALSVVLLSKVSDAQIGVTGTRK